MPTIGQLRSEAKRLGIRSKPRWKKTDYVRAIASAIEFKPISRGGQLVNEARAFVLKGQQQFYGSEDGSVVEALKLLIQFANAAGKLSKAFEAYKNAEAATEATNARRKISSLSGLARANPGRATKKARSILEPLMKLAKTTKTEAGDDGIADTIAKKREEQISDGTFDSEKFARENQELLRLAIEPRQDASGQWFVDNTPIPEKRALAMRAEKARLEASSRAIGNQTSAAFEAGWAAGQIGEGAAVGFMNARNTTAFAHAEFVAWARTFAKEAEKSAIAKDVFDAIYDTVHASLPTSESQAEERAERATTEWEKRF